MARGSFTGQDWPATEHDFDFEFIGLLGLADPVRAEVPLDLDMAISGKLQEQLSVPVDTVLALRPQVQGDIVARMQAQTAFRLFGPQEPVPMTIADARLRVPFDLTWFTRRAP